ncbi:hypothetical protein CGRA01v4_06576 [Colletotrichum graminicola]|nr:hypothetical protein CGRA01v4_06576 [Colletotrichum graminicola]
MNLRILCVVLAQIAVCWAVISKPNSKGALQHRKVGGPDCVLKGGEKIAVSWILSGGVIQHKIEMPTYNL